MIDDYGHHPTEIRAVLDAARASLGRRLIVAFQPHRYSRTARLMDRFGPALAQADELVLADIYAAGEDPIPGVTAEALSEAIRPQLQGRLHRARTLDGARAFRAQGGQLLRLAFPDEQALREIAAGRDRPQDDEFAGLTITQVGGTGIPDCVVFVDAVAPVMKVVTTG